MNSYDYIRRLLEEKHGVAADAITPDATLTSLGLDSLAIAELMFDVGEQYDIDLPDHKTGFNTLGEASALIDQLIQAKQ